MNDVLTEEECEAEVIRASAGTGKTFTLSNRYLRLLARGHAPHRILATTFTRKAAGEIQSRVLGRLAAAAAGDKAALGDLVEHADPQMTASKARKLLAALARDLHRLHICTLDSFFIRIAGSFTLELGLPPGWRIIDEPADRRLRNDAIRNVLNEEEPQRVIDLIRLLNPGEVRRSVHGQISNVVNVLYCVFQNQPAPAAWRWLDPPRQLDAAELVRAITAIQSIEWPEHKTIQKGAAKDVHHAHTRDWLNFLSKGLPPKVAAREPTYCQWDIPTHVAAAYQPLVTHARAVLLGRLASQTAATHELLEAFDRRYRRVKFLSRVLRFDDITCGLAAGSLAGRIDEVYYRLDAKIEHLLLDEFQDTSLPQWQVLEPLASEIAASAGRSFFCVGDVKQAIYGWRGGTAAIFDTLQARWPHLQPRSMDTTYRCRPAVVRAVNRVFGSLDHNEVLGRHGGAAAGWNFSAHEPAKTDTQGFVRVLSAPRAADGDKQSHTTLYAAAKLVRQVVDQGPGRTVGVLVRTNDAVARVIYALRQLGVFASEEGGNPLTDCYAVSVVLSMLRVADHPGDTAARFHVCTSPLGPIVGLDCHDDDLSAMRLASETRRALLCDGYGRTLLRWVRELAPSCDPRSLSRLLQLVELGHRYDADATLRPCDFVRLVEQQRVADPSAAPVRVMTVHQAKGLEFDSVVLPELDCAICEVHRDLVLVDRDNPLDACTRIVRYPNQVQRDHAPELEQMHNQAREAKLLEALSVLYVMMTRPRYSLHILIAPTPERERTVPATYAGLLRCALIDGRPAEPRKLLYHEGDDRWYAALPVKEAPDAAPAVEPEEAPRLAPSSAEHARILPQRSPSTFEGGRRVDLAQRLRLDRAGRARGVAIHARLQPIEWIENGAAVDDELRNLLEQPDVRRVLSRTSYSADADVSVLREEPFVVRLDDGLLAGSFDRLVLTRREGRAVAADVIDFKSDALGPEDERAVSARVEFYRPQLQAYRRAAAKLHRLDEQAVTAKLVFLAIGRVCKV